MALYIRRDEFVKTVLGPAVPGAQVYVCTQPANTTSLPPSPLATIYGDSDGITQLQQPLITDGFGHTYFYAAPNVYTIVVADNGALQQIYPDQSLGSGISLQTNGTPNTNQSIENLVAGANIDLTADGFGATIIDVTGVGIILQTNGVLNPDQALLNLRGGTGVTIVDDGVGNITFTASGSTTDIMSTNWHKITFANTAQSPNFVGDGISVDVIANGGLKNGLLYRAPFGTSPIMLQVGGAQPQEVAVYEQGANVLGDTDNGPINLSTLVRWQAEVAVGTIFLPAWTKNTRVPTGTVLLDTGTYYVSVTTGTVNAFTGTSKPVFDSTPGHTTSDSTATWESVGSTRPITFSDHFIGFADYVGTNIGGSGFFQFPLGMNPVLTNAPGPAYNFIGFRYLPEPMTANNNIGDTTWHAYVGGVDMTPSIVDTGVAPDNSGASHIFTVKQLSANQFTFYIDGILKATITASGLTTPFSSLIYGSNQQGNYNFSYNNDPIGLGATTFQGGNWWQIVSAGTPSGSFMFPPSPAVGDTATDGGVVWMTTWASGQAPPMAIAVSYIFWETSI